MGKSLTKQLAKVSHPITLIARDLGKARVLVEEFANMEAAHADQTLDTSEVINDSWHSSRMDRYQLNANESVELSFCLK